MTMAITARGLTKTYGPLKAVNNLNLDIPQGTVFGFLGPNGAGKTTTIRMLLGLIQPTAGSAQVLGHDIVRDRGPIAASVAAIVESPAFYTYLSGIDNLRVFARTSNLPANDQRLNQLLERVGLGGRGNNKVKQYSLGMKQRLGIAATLLNDPKIIFLDEPTNGLDPAGTVDMRNMIIELGKEGFTVFLSSHLLHEVENVCESVAIIQNGITIAQGRVQDLIASGGGATYQLEAGPFERAMGVLTQHPALQATSSDGHWISIRAEANAIPALVRALVAADVDVYQVQAHKQSLESIFLELTAQNGLHVPAIGPAAVAAQRG